MRWDYPALAVADPLTSAFAVLHIAGAAAVTIHALIRKRDVSTAIGWIALAWFSPLFGSILYLTLGINRVSRLSQRTVVSRPSLQAPDSRVELQLRSLEPLRLTVAKITGVAESTGFVSDILDSGDAGYPAMLEAIEGAKHSIALTTFIFRTDHVGRQFIDALGRAHRRGVAVRVLIDGFGGGYFLSRAFHQLRRQDVPVARFLHSVLPWKMPLLDMRLHKKMLIVDCEKAFAGGLNISSDNLLAEMSRNSVRDVHFCIRGQVVTQIARSFLDDWFFATSEVLDEGVWLQGRHETSGKPARAISSGPDQSVDHLVLVLISAINAAEKSIRIATPYFLPDETVMVALQLAALRGVTVDLVIPATNNHRVVGWAMRSHVRPLLKAGCRIWLSPGPFDHSKLTTIDESWCLIGSANWDARSLRLNFELNVELYDQELARRLSQSIDSRATKSLTLDQIDGRWGIVKVRDATARLLMPYL